MKYIHNGFPITVLEADPTKIPSHHLSSTRVFTPISLTCSLLWHPPEPTAWIPHTSFCWSDLGGRRTRSGRECSSPETGQCPSVFALKEERGKMWFRARLPVLWGTNDPVAQRHWSFLFPIPLLIMLSLRGSIHWGLTILQQALKYHCSQCS